MTRQPWDAYQERIRLKEKARLAGAGLEQHPFVRLALKSPAVLLKPDLLKKAHAFLDRHIARHVMEPHPFLPGPTPEEAGDGEIDLAIVVGGNGPEYPLRLKAEDYLTHQIDCGPVHTRCNQAF